ncbi:unnamed protein product [Parascedosporium putredinis]|uniref:beta-glucosidase n=1 Tax=Parascedosporium putredinis TaxID=1442378 RepID=A0A9P1M830_9PEZI|nr:unnamed protein product [Parascedosporium putredinis]CAI7991784.1 unnamed protein product [Parascedosporium putredinis]
MDYTTLLPELKLEEKISLLSGSDFSHAAGIPRLNIPATKVADSINGVRPSNIAGSETTACFPNTTCLASTWDRSLLASLGTHVARQARLKSAQVVLGPTINIHRDPRAGRNFECWSEDPVLTGELAAALVNGIQDAGVGACAKHFVCNDSETARQTYDVKESVDSRTLREIYLAAWQVMLRKSDPLAVMTAYNKVDGQFCSENYALLNVLRETWGFKGIAMSDWFGTHSTADSVKAGVDLEMPFPVLRGQRLLNAVREGQVTEAEIDRRRCEEFADTNDLARKIAAAGVVLVKNEGHVLPVDPAGGPKKIALIDVLPGVFAEPHSVEYAPGVRTNVIMPVAPTEKLKLPGGEPGVKVDYYNQGAADPIFTEVLEKPVIFMLERLRPGLEALGSRLEMTTLLTADTAGTHTLAPGITTEQFIFRPLLIETRLKLSMAAGQTFSRPVRIRGFDLEDMSLRANQIALIKAVAAASKQTVLVLHCGNPIDVSPFIDDVDAVLIAHFPGQEGAMAVAEVISGAVNPSGKLATTWFKTLQDVPSYKHFPAKQTLDGKMEISYTEGLEVGYRCKEADTKARWPFGFGLSYTTFAHKDLTARVVEAAGSVGTLDCSVLVTNTGTRGGKEVVQLFVTAPVTAAVWRPAKELKEFTTVYLEPGESKEVTLSVALDSACSYWDEEAASWRLEAGQYGVCVGESQASFEVTEGKLWNHL